MVSEAIDKVMDELYDGDYSFQETRKGGAKSFTKGEIGTTGLDMVGGRVFESRLRNFQGHERNIVIREMAETDAIIAGMLSAYTVLGTTAELTVLTDGDSAEDTKAVEFIKSLFNDMAISWKDTHSAIFSALPFGFVPMELVFKLRQGQQSPNSNRPTSKFDDGMIGWHKWGVRAQDTIMRWQMDDHGEIEGYWQSVKGLHKGVSEVFIPMTKSLLFRTDTSKNNPQGRSMMESIYRAWFFKRHFEELLGIGVKRDLVNFPIMSFPKNERIWAAENKKHLDKAEELITHLSRDELEGIVKPEDVKLEGFTSGGARQFSLSDLIKALNLEIAIGLGTEFVLVGHEAAGSFALKREDFRKFFLMLDATLKKQEDVINRFAIPQIIQLNGIQVTEMPTLKFGPVDQPTLEETVGMLERFDKMGIAVAAEEDIVKDLFARMRLPEPELKEESTNRDTDDEDGGEDGDLDVDVDVDVDDDALETATAELE